MFVVTINGIGTLRVQEPGVTGVIGVRNILSVEGAADNIVQLAVTVTVKASLFSGAVRVGVAKVVVHGLR